MTRVNSKIYIREYCDLYSFTNYKDIIVFGSIVYNFNIDEFALRKYERQSDELFSLATEFDIDVYLYLRLKKYIKDTFGVPVALSNNWK
jgi:hypothetical protein